MTEPRQGELSFSAPVYTVRQLVAEVSGALAMRWRRVSVAGQACDVRRSDLGHVYFSLKDETARLSAILWRSDAVRLRFELEEGMEVVATGTLGIYPARGQFQIQVSAIQPVGVGAMQIALEQLRRRLAADGLFDEARKRSLPFLPRCVGIVTSPHGAAIRDFLHVLNRRHPDLRVTIFPARVQGEGAVAQLVEGLRVLPRLGCEVVVLARGGGSAEDLAAFNDERLARAAAACAVPVISAVGHETDWTLVDFVADLRAATPSAAAEIVVGAKEEIVRRVVLARRGLGQLARRRLAELRGRLVQATGAESLVRFRYALMRRRDRFEAAREALAGVAVRFVESPGRRTSRARERLSDAARLLRIDRRSDRVGRLESAAVDRMRARTVSARARLAAGAGRLRALDPLAILARGYAVVFRADAPGRPITDAAALRRGELVDVRLARGRIAAKVDEVSPASEGGSE